MTNVTIPLRLRHQIDFDRLVSAINSMTDCDRKELLQELFGYFEDELPPTQTLVLDSDACGAWYRSLETEEKEEFLSDIGVEVVNLEAVEMKTRHDVSDNSSVFESIGYNDAYHRLEVHFKHGAIYQYAFVEPIVFYKFMASESLGSYYNTDVKGQYKSIRVN